MNIIRAIVGSSRPRPRPVDANGSLISCSRHLQMYMPIIPTVRKPFDKNADGRPGPHRQQISRAHKWNGTEKETCQASLDKKKKTRNSLARSTRSLIARLELDSFYNKPARFKTNQLDL
jgi:hypothetical protein